MSTSEKVRAKTHYHHGDLRQQLVTATRLLVEEKGQDNFSVSDACRKAGVSTAAPYRHFSDRGEMLHAVAMEGMSELNDSFQKTLEDQEDGSLEAIVAIGLDYVNFALRNPGTFRMMFAHHERDEDLKAEGEACFGTLLNQVALNTGLDPEGPDVRAASLPLWTYVHGLSFLAIDCKVEFANPEADLPNLVRFGTLKLLAA